MARSIQARCQSVMEEFRRSLPLSENTDLLLNYKAVYKHFAKFERQILEETWDCLFRSRVSSYKVEMNFSSIYSVFFKNHQAKILLDLLFLII